MDPLLEAFFAQDSHRSPQSARNMESSDSKWDKIKQSKTALPASLVDALLEIVTNNKQLQDKIDALEHSTKDPLVARQSLIEENEALRHRLSASPFVLLLIDGDATQFSDSFVTAGPAGGHKAAHQLQQSLEDFMERKLGLPPATRVVIRIYMNAVGLKTVYVSAGILSQSSMLWEFVQAFNRELPLAEFIDSGPDKEAADNKIKANIDLFWRNENCKHILLAGSADRGYVNYLRQYSFRKEDRSRLTLIETKPFPQDFKELASSFGNTQGHFEGLFRSNHLVALRAGATPKAAVAIPYAALAAQSPRLAVAPAVQSPSSRSQSPASSEDWIPVQRNSGKHTLIPLNKRNQRIHKPLEPYDGAKANEIRARNICPYKVLTRCIKPDCDFSHKEVALSEEDRRVLIYIHRITPCPAGFACRDRNCVSGHHCLYDETCYFKPCRYTKEQHNVDKTVVREI